MTHQVLAGESFNFKHLKENRLNPKGKMLRTEHTFVTGKDRKKLMTSIEEWNPYNPQIRFTIN